MTGRPALVARHRIPSGGTERGWLGPIAGSLESALAETLGEAPSITKLVRRPATSTTGYESEILTLDLASGPQIQVFLKDYGRRRLPKVDSSDRSQREIAVYRDLLRDAGLDTATYHGAVWDASQRWLLLGFVEDARELRSCGLDAWVDAAAWLGRLQGWFAGDDRLLETAAFLPPHDADFFRHQATSASNAVERIDGALAARLSGVLADYERLVEVLARQPRTLVHGSFRPQNILVADRDGSRRICVVDWEHAALGSVLYDLAFISQGFRAAELDALVGAWRREAEARGVPLPDEARLPYLLDCFRLAKVVRSLGDAVALRFHRTAVEWYVAMAEELREALG